MSCKYTECTEEYSIEESNPFANVKIDNDLFKEDDYLPQKLIQVKRINLSKGTEEWKIFEDKDIVLVLKGSRFTNKEKEFLRTPNGFKFIIDGFKNGWRSINKFKQNMELK
jgi:hypothetical protein